MGNEQAGRLAAPRHYVNGAFSLAGTPFPLVDPVTGRTVAQVPEADVAMVDGAVQAARAALRGPWGSLDVTGRVELLRAVADRIEQRFDEFVAAEIADLALGQAEQAFRTPTPDGLGALNYTVHKPLGVVAIVSPWNLPLLLLTWKVAPALAAGNTVVAKPSEITPSSATLLAEAMDEVGVPAGVFNLASTAR